jgi:hypothetical protein
VIRIEEQLSALRYRRTVYDVGAYQIASSNQYGSGNPLVCK